MKRPNHSTTQFFKIDDVTIVQMTLLFWFHQYCLEYTGLGRMQIIYIGTVRTDVGH